MAGIPCPLIEHGFRSNSTAPLSEFEVCSFRPNLTNPSIHQSIRRLSGILALDRVAGQAAGNRGAAARLFFHIQHGPDGAGAVIHDGQAHAGGLLAIALEAPSVVPNCQIDLVLGPG